MCLVGVYFLGRVVGWSIFLIRIVFGRLSFFFVRFGWFFEFGFLGFRSSRRFFRGTCRGFSCFRGLVYIFLWGGEGKR